MISLKFNIGPSRNAIRAAQELLDDPTPMFEEIREDQVNEHRQRFAKGVGPDGNAWAPKSAATIENYKRRGYGNLSRPLIGPTKRLSREILGFASRDGVVIGSNQIQAETMQSGAAKGAFGRDRRGRPIPWGRIPARVWLGLSAQGERHIIEIADEQMAAKLDQKG